MYISKGIQIESYGRSRGIQLENNEKRKTFGEFLKVLFLRNHFRQTAVAAHLNISRQRLGLVCAGKAPLSDRLFNMIHTLLSESGAKEKDLKELSRLFVESKVSIPGSMLGNPDELFKTATELRDYMDLEKALAKCLEIASHERNFDMVMNGLAEIVGTRTGSHFCAIYQYENNYTSARMIYEWRAAGCPCDTERFREVPSSPQSEWLQQFRRKRVVNIFNPSRPRFPLQHPILIPDVKAVLCSGIWFNGQVGGVMMALKLKQIRNYPEIEERLIRKVCSIIQLVMERRHFDSDPLFTGKLCLSDAVVAPPLMLFNSVRELCSMTKSCCELLNLSEEEAITSRIWDRICEANPEVTSPLDACLREKHPANAPMFYNRRRYMLSALPLFDRFGNIQNVTIAWLEFPERTHSAD